MANSLVMIKKAMEIRREDISKMIPGSAPITFENVLQSVQNAILSNSRIGDCTPDSIYHTTLAACKLGLLVGPPNNHAHIVPYGNSATLQIGYGGFIELAYRSGMTRISANVIYKNDEFEYELGDNERIFHKPDFSSLGKDSEMIGAYACAYYNHGNPSIVVMSKDEIEKIKSGSKNKQLWIKHQREFWKKTVIKQLAKRLRLTPEFSLAKQLSDNEECGNPARIKADIDSGCVIVEQQNTAQLNADSAMEQLETILEVDND